MLPALPWLPDQLALFELDPLERAYPLMRGKACRVGRPDGAVVIVGNLRPNEERASRHSHSVKSRGKLRTRIPCCTKIWVGGMTSLNDQVDSPQ